jgi:hypothetical protein
VRRGDVDVAFGLDYSSAPIPRSGDVQLVLLRTERFGLVTADGTDRDPGALAELADFADADTHRDKVAAVTATVRAVVQACPNIQPTPQTGRP